jgi:DNA-binding MarR family transcriptional regulator
MNHYDETQTLTSLSSLAHLVLETFPRVMGHVSCTLRRKSPIDNQVHFHVLRMLREKPRSIHELAEESVVRLPTMSRTVDTLEHRKWVKRFRQEGDRRTVYVRITKEGEQALEKTEKIALQRASALLENLGPEAKRELFRGLSALHEHMILLGEKKGNKG